MNDAAIVEAIGQALAGTSRFESVIVGRAPREARVSPDRASVAWIKRAGTSRQPMPDAEPLGFRVVKFDVWLSARGPNNFGRTARLYALEAVALGAINNRSLAGLTMPVFTLLDRGRDEGETDIASTVRLTGTFTYDPEAA